MAIQPLTPLPTPPLPTDGEDAFDQHAGESLTAQVTFTNEMNANVIPGINAAVQQVHDDAIYAGQAAARAEAVDTNVGDQVAAAEAARDSAQTAAAAAGSAAGLPSLTGNAGKFLGVNAAANGVAWLDVGQKVGDVLTSARVPDASYLPMNSGIYLQSAYPALFSVVGLIGGVAGSTWANVSSGTTGTIRSLATDDKGTWLGVTSQANTIVRSTDNGATWAIVTALIGGNAIWVDTDGNGVWVAALSSASGGSTIWRSADNGLTWAAIGTSTTSKNCISTDRAGTWIVSGTDTAVLRSVDNGLTWASISSFASGAKIIATDRNGVWVCSASSGAAYRSTDNGLTWSNLAATPVFTALATGRQGTWIGVGASGAMSISSNNGITFSTTSSGVPVNLSAVTADGNGNWLAIGASNTVIRSSDNAVSWSTVTGAVAYVPASVAISVGDTAVIGGPSGALSRSLPAYPYDTSTQFRVPLVNGPQGIKSYIKAKVAA